MWCTFGLEEIIHKIYPTNCQRDTGIKHLCDFSRFKVLCNSLMEMTAFSRLILVCKITRLQEIIMIDNPK